MLFRRQIFVEDFDGKIIPDLRGTRGTPRDDTSQRCFAFFSLRLRHWLIYIAPTAHLDGATQLFIRLRQLNLHQSYNGAADFTVC